MKRLFVKVTRDTLPQVKDKYPFIYLERGRLEIDDASLKWLDAEGHVVRLPVAVLKPSYWVRVLLSPMRRLKPRLRRIARYVGWERTVYCSMPQAFCPQPQRET